MLKHLHVPAKYRFIVARSIRNHSENQRPRLSHTHTYTRSAAAAASLYKLVGIRCKLTPYIPIIFGSIVMVLFLPSSTRSNRKEPVTVMYA